MTKQEVRFLSNEELIGVFAEAIGSIAEENAREDGPDHAEVQKAEATSRLARTELLKRLEQRSKENQHGG